MIIEKPLEFFKMKEIIYWNNFTVSELKDILRHITALEELGIAQNEETVASIKNDLAIREKQTQQAD
jgi:hypothetical protein